MDFAIIAAGEGSRLRLEGVRRPKPLVELNGVPMAERLMRMFIDNGAASVSVIINEEMQEVRRYLQGIRLPVPFHLVVKSTPGSMLSFFHLRHLLKEERFCLTTVDTVFREEEFRNYIRAFRREEAADGLMAVTNYIDDEKPLYANTDPGLIIRSFTDEPEAQSRYVSGGVYCLKRPALKTLEQAVEQNKIRMRSFQRLLLAQGFRLKAYPFGKIVDVDHAGDIAEAERLLNA